MNGTHYYDTTNQQSNQTLSMNFLNAGNGRGTVQKHKNEEINGSDIVMPEQIQFALLVRVSP